MALVALCQQGSDAAFNVLYNRYRLQLFSYLHKLLPNNDPLIDDIFQQIWIKAIANWKRYNDQQRLLAWLCRIGHNLVMDHFRKMKHQQYVELDEGIQPPSEYITATEQIDQNAFDDALMDAIPKLSAEQQDVLKLRRDGYSFKEIAEMKNTNVNTVLARMHYAVTKLKDMLKDYIN